MDFDVVVVGSGLGGLAAATGLARQGVRVGVFEQHRLPGGWSQSFEMRGYRWSPGIHYIGGAQPGGGFRRYCEGLGVSEHLGLLRLNPDGYDHLRIGDFAFDIPEGADRFAARLCEAFPRERDAIARIFAGIEALVRERESGLGLRGNGTERALRALSVPWRKRNLLWWGLGSWNRFLDRFTPNPLLRAALSITCGNHGLAPSRVAAAVHASVIDHYLAGGVFPRGGAGAVARAFTKVLEAHGGQLFLRAPVARILVRGEGASRRAVGVRLADGRELSAHTVISNADAHQTYTRLLDPGVLSWRLRRRLRRTRLSVSALSLFLATDLDLEGMGLDSGNYWYAATPDIEAGYRVAGAPTLAGLEAFPVGFVSVTSLKDRLPRADGLHTLESFVFVSPRAFDAWRGSAHRRRPAAYERFKQTLTNCMLRGIERVVPGISEHVRFSALATPLTIDHYVAATGGAIFGPEKSLLNIGPLGLPYRTELPGLYHCGASTHVGHGVVAAISSGISVAQQVLGVSRSEILSAAGPALCVEPCEPLGSDD